MAPGRGVGGRPFRWTDGDVHLLEIGPVVLDFLKQVGAPISSAGTSHAMDEDRFLAVGVSEKSRVLKVVYCENETGSEVRIISARKATKREQRSAFGRNWS